MQDSRSTCGALEAHDRRPLRRGVTARHRIAAPYHDAEQAIRICLDDLIEHAFPLLHPSEYGSGSLAAVTMKREPTWLRVPVAFEVEMARSRPGQIAHLRWRAVRLSRCFPFMEADVLIRLSRPSGTELVVEGSYEPPFGLLGALGDALIGRIVARSTVDAFVDGLAGALEGALAGGRCRRVSMTGVSSEVA